MIQANELRIGNIINDSFNRPGAVLEFSRKTIRLKLEHSTLVSRALKGNTLSDLDFSPTVLNEEWAKKFDFEDHGDYMTTPVGMLMFYYRKGDCFVQLGTTDEDEEDVYDTTICSVQFVHQLQNLYFSLTGTELTHLPESRQSHPQSPSPDSPK